MSCFDRKREKLIGPTIAPGFSYFFYVFILAFSWVLNSLDLAIKSFATVITVFLFYLH